MANYQIAENEEEAGLYTAFLRQAALNDGLYIPGDRFSDNPSPGVETPESRFSKLITYMYRYMSHYAKAFEQKWMALSLAEFTYVGPMVFKESMTKKDLILYNVHEKTSGTEIINRLVRKGYLTETPNPDDGRSKLLKVTESGRAAFFEVLPSLDLVSKQLVAPLDKTSLESLLHLLEPLHQVHFQNWIGDASKP